MTATLGQVLSANEDEEDRLEKEVTLAHLLNRRHVMRPVYRQLQDMNYFIDFEDLHLIFHFACEYMKLYDRCPSYELYKLNLAGMADELNISEDVARAAMTKLGGLLQEYEWHDELVQDWIKESIKEEEMRRYKDALESEDIDEALEKLPDFSTSMQADPFQQITLQNPFDDLANNMEVAQRTPLGVDFLDYILDGGVCKGEAIGILAPSGGGKTTLALQIADAQVIARKHVLYISTEQKLRGDVSIRSYCLAAKAPRDAFKNGLDNVPPEIVETLEMQKKYWLQYFHFMDVSDLKIQTLEQIYKPLEDLIAQGKPPSLIIIDWWGRLRDNLTLNHVDVANKSESRARIASRDWLHNIKQKAEKYDAATVVFHQLAGAEAKKSAKSTPSVYAAQEDSNFSNMFDFAFALSNRNAMDNARLSAGKARGAAKMEATVHLDGRYCRFKRAEDVDSTIESMNEGIDEEVANTTSDYVDDNCGGLIA